MLKIVPVSKEKFFSIFPPATRNVTVNGEVAAQLGTEIICDLCNNDVITEENPDTVYLVENTQTTRYCYALCSTCQKPFVTKEGK